MPLAERVNCPPKAIHGADCSVGVLLRTLPDSEAEALRVMLADFQNWTARAIWKAATDEGHWIGFQSIGRHRRQACRCFMAGA